MLVALLLQVGAQRVLAQGMPPAKPRYWVNPENGKLYWNKNLPAFVMLSPLPTGDSATILDSHSTPQWGRPFYFDTEGVNYMRTRYAVDTATRQTIMPKREILWEVYSDGLPPETRVAVEGGKRRPDGRLYANSETKITLLATDAVSGVRRTHYSLDSTRFVEYTGSFSPEQEGNLTLYYCSEDQVGNREKMRTMPIVVDFTPPSSECVVVGVHLDRENTIAKSTTIYIEAEDKGAGLAATYYRIDSGAWQRYPARSKIPLETIADGRHTLSFYSEDLLGNREPEQHFAFFLDDTAPITISDILGDRFIVGDKTFFSGRTKLKITAVDNHAGVKEVLYSVNDGPFVPYTEPFYMPNEQGWHRVRYFSIDSMENRTTGDRLEKFYEYRMKVDRIYVDLTGPTISHSLQGPSFSRNDTVFVSPLTRVTLSGQDPESGLKRLAYSIDGDAWEKLYEAPFDLQGLESGEHGIEYFGYDNVENRNVGSFFFILDSDPPRVDYQLSVAPYKDGKGGAGVPIFPVDSEVFLMAQDNMTGVKRLEYSLNGKPRTAYTKPFGGLERGKNRLLVYVEDMVGNSAETMLTFEVR